MKAKISTEHRSKFTPNFRTVVMGKPKDVSLHEAENQAEIWLNSPMVILYENGEKLRQELLKRQKKQPSVKLDMALAKRGKSFDPSVSNQSAKQIELFKLDQAKSISKIKKIFDAEKIKKSNIKSSKTKKNIATTE